MTASVKVRAHAATIDIIDSRTPPADRREGGGTIIIPNEIYVDGIPLFLPSGSRISMEVDGIGESAVEVNMTFFVRRVRVGYADELDGLPGELPGTVAPEPEEQDPAHAEQGQGIADAEVPE
ncbi:hypothetical protein [Streptosporangium roseum]|uniref:hypothetical protein n=1 Tax=Streptosporangium roseum TaxID=2001 RepID=UPI0033211236